MDFIKFSNQLYNEGISFIIVTLAQVKGSAPQDVGAKMFVTKQGLYSGTIGGGKIEAYAIHQALQLLEQADSGPLLQDINLQKDIKMSCGGIVTLFYEPQNIHNWKINIFGAGHVAQALVKVLITLKCQITVFDTREDWLAKLPNNSKLNKNTVSINHNQITRDSYCIIMTRGHSTDLPILLELAKLDFQLPYIGVIGSATKSSKLKSKLLDENVADNFLEKLHCPIGLQFGNNSPEEIAISITAQLLTVRDLLGSNR